MAVRDFLSGDAFSAITLTELVNHVPPLKTPVGSLGLFEGEGIATRSLAIWEEHGALGILKEKTPGSPPDQMRHGKATVRGFSTYHFPVADQVRAEDMASKIVAGSETEIQSAWQAEVDKRLAALRQLHELTLEWHRFQALRGYIISGDGSTALKDLFTEFAVSGGRPAPTDCALGTSTTELIDVVGGVKQSINDALGFEPPTYYGYMSPKFFRKFCVHPKIKDFWRNAKAENLGADLSQTGFQWEGITWKQHASKQGSGSLWLSEGASVEGVDMSTGGHAMIFGGGVPGLYKTYYSPANRLDAIGRPGVPVSISTEILPHNSGLDLLSESNIICLCTRPAAVRTLYSSN